MALRLHSITKCLCCLIFVHIQPWLSAKAVTVKGPPNPAAAVEAQAKFFQYRHLPTHEDYDQGHRLGSERHFTERHERARPSEGLFSAKVRWGDKKGGYGEHYWDLNHAGHNNDHDHGHNYSDDGYDSNTDDGSYDPQVHEDPYDEPSDQTPTYEGDYNPDNYDESNRAKRHHYRHHEEDSKQRVYKPKRQRNEEKETNESSEEYEEKIPEPPPTPKRNHKKSKQFKPVPKEQDYEEDYEQKVITLKDIEEDRKPKHFKKPEQVVTHENTKEEQPEYSVRESDEEFPPYDTTRVRQRDFAHEVTRARQPETFATPEAAPRARQPEKFTSYDAVNPHTPLQPIPPPSRLYLQASTGHVIDRITGQAYVLQPVALSTNPINYN